MRISEINKTMGTGWCVTKTSGRAGLGNELVVWAKAHLAAQALGGICVPPAWGINPRGYGKYFRSSRLDILRNEALLRLIPRTVFTEEMYDKTGFVDYGEAIQAWTVENGFIERALWCCAAEGMWGGYLAIRRAREFLRKELLLTRWTVENLTEYSSLVDPNRLQIAFHIRRGDFLAPVAPTAYRNKFCVAIPSDWYLNVGRCLQQALGKRNIQFTVISDAPSEVLEPLTNELAAITTHSQHHRDISDVLILSMADVLVCSISSFSLLAAFLSKGFYLWYEPQLNLDACGLRSLWGGQLNQQSSSSPTRRNAQLSAENSHAVPRGLPVGVDGILSNDDLEMISALHRPTYCDLIHYGVVRSEAYA